MKSHTTFTIEEYADMKHLLSYIFFTLLCLHVNSQQKGSKPFHFSIDAGIGGYNTFTSAEQYKNGKGSGGLSYMFAASLYRNMNVFKIRYLVNKENALGLGIVGPSPDEKLIDFGLLYGKTVYLKENVKLNILAGAGFLKGNIRGKEIPEGGSFFGTLYEDIKIFVPTFIQEAEFVYYPSKHFGLGISLTGNINTKSSH